MQAKSNHVPETIKVQSDNGSLRLQFSTKYNPIFAGKRKHQGLAMKDTPENWQKAVAIAWRIEEDLQHADWQLLFDPTFAKYGLKTKYAAELKLAAPIPEPEPEMTVGAMWEDYLIWKQPQLEPTTFHATYQVTYTNSLKGLVWNSGCAAFSESKKRLWDVRLDSNPTEILQTLPLASASKKGLTAALQAAFRYSQGIGKTKLTINPFDNADCITENKTDKYKSVTTANGVIRQWHELIDNETDPEEKDRRAFTKEERDIIIKAFYESERKAVRQIAPLIEFYFLTGCRSGEAFALTWNNVRLDSGQIVIHKSYASRQKLVKKTKNDDIRLFLMYPRLRALLLRIQPITARPTDLVFPNTQGDSYSSTTLGNLWNKNSTNASGIITAATTGIVRQLADSGAISCYLSPYHTRHTFITLQARSGVDLVMLASMCSTGVEIIMKHYLEHDKTAQLTDI
ncbi:MULTISPECIES: tyrosine-type recombinase/integrase [unclassified Microcoleus]|uniref:tyrosine-type recombinase/integrase n=1 Tax=unclassified Microcoleus TaxID=2642155 RepID=UPI002FCFBF99